MNNYAYSVDLQRLVNVEEVQRGLKCECFDPNDLSIKLVARKGDVNIHHFAIYNPDGSNSEYVCNETAEHKLAKEEIAKNLEVCGIKLKQVELEKHKLINTDKLLNFVPDIQAITIANETLFIEIVMHNDIDDRKLEKIKLLNINVVKIYVDDPNTLHFVHTQTNSYADAIKHKANMTFADLKDEIRNKDDANKLLADKNDKQRYMLRQLNLKYSNYISSKDHERDMETLTMLNKMDIDYFKKQLENLKPSEKEIVELKKSKEYYHDKYNEMLDELKTLRIIKRKFVELEKSSNYYYKRESDAVFGTPLNVSLNTFKTKNALLIKENEELKKQNINLKYNLNKKFADANY